MKKKAARILAVVVLFGGFMAALQKVTVNSFDCVSQFGECAEPIRKSIEMHVGGSYFGAKNSVSRELSANARVKKFHIRFGFPDRMTVEIEERRPEVAAKFGEGNYYLFDSEGMSLGSVSETELPVVLVYGVPSDGLFMFGMRLARDVQKYYQAENMRIGEHGLYAQIRGGVEVIFPLEGDPDVLLGSLEVSLSQLNRGLRDSTIALANDKNYQVDLRYKNPVISQI